MAVLRAFEVPLGNPEQGARFRLPFVSLGLVPEAASSFLLPYIAGYQRAAELLLLAQPFGVEKALAAGIVTEVVPEDELLDYARDAALGVAALPPAAVQQSKALMKKAFAARAAQAMQEEGAVFRERLASPEAKEAMTAFFEKRKPDFTISERMSIVPRTLKRSMLPFQRWHPFSSLVLRSLMER